MTGRPARNRSWHVPMVLMLWAWVVGVFAVYLENFKEPIRLMLRALFG
jgi:hypothetical protein